MAAAAVWRACRRACVCAAGHVGVVGWGKAGGGGVWRWGGGVVVRKETSSLCPGSVQVAYVWEWGGAGEMAVGK